MKTLVRTITYTGDEEWLNACIDNSFVALKQELGEGRSITSQWHDAHAQERAQQKMDDRKRYLRDLARKYIDHKTREIEGEANNGK